MDKLGVGSLISDLETGTQHIILWVSPDDSYGFWYNLHGRPQKPSRFSMNNIFSEISEGRYDIEPYIVSEIWRSEDTLSDKEREHRERTWDNICSVVENEPDIYDNKLRPQLLLNASKETGIDQTNLYKLLKRYWESGKNKNAFLPKYSNCGAKGVQRSSYKKKSDTELKFIGKTLTDDDRKNFEQAIRRYYLNRSKNSLKYAYEKLLQDHYTIAGTDGAKKLKLREPHELPSLRQFRYWYSKNKDVVTESKKRDGERKFNLDGRSVLGKSDYGMMGPGTQYQIDATVGDIYLVSRVDRNNLIGRPVMYFVIDTFSRMVTGMCIALEGPSWASAMMAIANMAADKVAYCRQFGVEIKENEWACRHVPASLLGDRGEMESKNADNLVNMLGIRIVNAPPYRADLKGIIEQNFRTINTNSVALLPGSVKPDMSKRGGNDYRLDAILDIHEFTRIIIECVKYYNNHHYMDYFEKSEAMMRDNVEAIPCRIWEWGIKNCSGELRFFPEEMVRMAVLPTNKATVTENGIKFKGLLYSSDRAVREKWFEKARSKKTWSVNISYDPRDMANLYIWNQDDKKYDTCYLLEWNQKYNGKYLDEVIYEQKKEILDKKRIKLSEIEAKINLNAEIDAIVSNAKGLAAGLPAKSKKERISNIKENRKNERESIGLGAGATDDNVQNTAILSQKQSSQADEDLDPITLMIKKKVEGRVKNE